MGHAILWLASLTGGVLLVAFAVAEAAHAARMKEGRLAPGLPFAVALVPFAVGVVVCVVTGRLHSMGLRPSYLIHSLSCTTVLVLAAFGVIHVGWRARSEDGSPWAAAWPRGVLLAAFCVSIAVYIGTLLHMDAKVRRVLVDVKAEAIELARSVAPTPVPDERNAEVVYRQALELAGGRDVFRSVLGVSPWEITDPGFDATTDEVAAFLRQKDKALVLLRKAASMPDYYFEACYVPPRLDMRTPDFILRRNAANLLTLDAHHRAAKGDMEGALDDVAAVWGMARHLAGAPTLIGCMIAVTIDATGSGPVQELLASGSVRRDDLRSFPLHPDVSFTEAHGRAMAMEEATLLYVSAEPYFYKVQGRECSTPRGIHWRVFVVSAYLVWHRPSMRLAQQLASKPFHAAREGYAAIEAGPLSRHDGLPSYRGLVPNVSAALAVAEAEARHRLAVLGVAAACFRTEEDRYPKELAELVPDYISAVPVDPFDARPLKMIREGDGLVLYSAGRDGQDDGGRDSGWGYGGTDPKGDISFCLGEAYRSRVAASRKRARRRRARRPARRAPRY